MAGGRPTKYSKKILKLAEWYLTEYASLGDMIPSLAGLSIVLEISRETVRSWGHEEDKKEFSAILDKIKASQERILLNKGLSGDFNSNIVKLALGKHGYQDKQDVTSSDGTMTPRGFNDFYGETKS